MIKIHNFARGARGLRVFWQCEEMNLRYEVAVVPFPADDAYRALHPLGSVPFLEDEGGVAISESLAMMLYLAHRYGPTPLLPDDETRARVLQMTVFSEASIGGPLNLLLATHFVAPEADKRNWSATMAEKRVEQAIGYVSDTLGTREYLAGDRFSLADIAITTALGMWKGALGQSIPDRLTEYRTRLAERPAYQRATKRQTA